MDLDFEPLADVVRALEQMQLPYAISGSVALGLWAVPRTTHDVDIVVALPAARIAEFCAHFPPDRYYIDPAAMADAFRHAQQPSRGMYSFLHMPSGLKLDLFPLRPSDPVQVSTLQHRVLEDLTPGLRAAVCAPEDLLIQKLEWYSLGHSQRQFQDCLNLVLSDQERAVPQIDWTQVDTRTHQLGPAIAHAWQVLKAAVAATQEPPAAPDDPGGVSGGSDPGA